MRITPRALMEAAKIVIEGGSNDATRAAMRLLNASTTLCNGVLASVYQRAQDDIIKELARLKENDLVTYHAEAALKRVTNTLKRMVSNARVVAGDLVLSALITGKLGMRSRSPALPKSTAFLLAQGDNENAARMVSQYMGQIEHAAGCAAQSVRQRVNNACLRASMPKDMQQQGEGDDVAVSIEAGAEIEAKEPPKQSVFRGGLSRIQKALLRKNPNKAAKELEKQARIELRALKETYLIGRREADTLRENALKALAVSEAKGTVDAAGEMLNELLKEGVGSFVDRGGRRWSLPVYCQMATRTTAMQSANMGVIFDDEEHDLYYIVNKSSSCPICAKYEGRVYSRSGRDPDYPPLAEAFGRIDKNADVSLANSYLCIHPNCRHAIAKFYPDSLTEKELQRIKKRSQRPFEIDPRKKEQIERYNELERQRGITNAARAKYRQFAQFIPYRELGTFDKFERAYRSKSAKYEELEARFLEKSKKV